MNPRYFKDCSPVLVTQLPGSLGLNIPDAHLPCHVTQGPCLTHSHPGSKPSCVMKVFLLHAQFSALTKIELFYLQKTKMLVFSYLHSPLCKYKILISLLYYFRMFDFKTWCLSYTHTHTHMITKCILLGIRRRFLEFSEMA